MAALVGIVLLVVGGLGVGWWAFNQIEKVEVADVLSPPSPSGMNILVVGTDSLEGSSPTPRTPTPSSVAASPTPGRHAPTP
ncbi:MAG: hypothetical protein R2690_10840 [Acidimicrobiales bacterium]